MIAMPVMGWVPPPPCGEGWGGGNGAEPGFPPTPTLATVGEGAGARHVQNGTIPIRLGGWA